MLHPQLQQFLTLLLLFVLGKYAAFVFPSWTLLLLLLTWAVLVEHLLIYLEKHRFTYVSYSGLSTAIGVLLMMVALQGWIYAVVIALSLIQKRFVSVAGVHFFNPSNFALMAALLLFYAQAHLVLGQMGDAWWLRALVWGLAGAILLRVDRWMIPLAFVAGYLILEHLWLVDYDPVMTFETIYERFYSVSFTVFVAFMLTDPRTTPSKRWLQVCFGLAVALVAVGLDRWHGFRVQHLFMALFLLSPWVPWLQAEGDEKKRFLFWGAGLFFVAMGAIILIENRPPYYFEMNR